MLLGMLQAFVVDFVFTKYQLDPYTFGCLFRHSLDLFFPNVCYIRKSQRFHRQRQNDLRLPLGKGPCSKMFVSLYLRVY